MAGLLKVLNISTHALREEGDRKTEQFQVQRPISTHALREEGDGGLVKLAVAVSGFLPTPSARRATCQGLNAGLQGLISTHALREEGDLFTFMHSA